jgi:hypothetical protein
MKLSLELIILIFKHSNHIQYKLLSLSFELTKSVLYYLPFIKPYIISKILNPKIFELIINKESNLSKLNTNFHNKYLSEILNCCVFNANNNYKLINRDVINFKLDKKLLNCFNFEYDQCLIIANILLDNYDYKVIRDIEFWNYNKKLRDDYLHRWCSKLIIIEQYIDNDLHKTVDINNRVYSPYHIHLVENNIQYCFEDKQYCYYILFNIININYEFDMKYYPYLKKLLNSNTMTTFHRQIILNIINQSVIDDDYFIYDEALKLFKIDDLIMHFNKKRCVDVNKANYSNEYKIIDINFIEILKLINIFKRNNFFNLFMSHFKIFSDIKLTLIFLKQVVLFELDYVRKLIVSNISLDLFIIFKLFLAIQNYQNESTIKIYLNINNFYDFDNEIFLQACFFGNLELVKLMISNHNVNPDSIQDGLTIVLTSCGAINIELIKLLVTKIEELVIKNNVECNILFTKDYCITKNQLFLHYDKIKNSCKNINEELDNVRLKIKKIENLQKVIISEEIKPSDKILTSKSIDDILKLFKRDKYNEAIKLLIKLNEFNGFDQNELNIIMKKAIINKDLNTIKFILDKAKLEQFIFKESLKLASESSCDHIYLLLKNENLLRFNSINL